MRILWLTVLVLTATSLGVTTLGAQEVYRSFDAEGNVVYSDRPHGADAEAVRVLTASPARAATATPAQAPAEPPPGQQSEALGGEMTREPTTEELRELRARNCTVANERLENYTLSHRLYRTLPDGERQYLSSEEIDEARTRAAADVDTWCD